MSFTTGGDGPGFADASAAFRPRRANPAEPEFDDVVTGRLADAIIASGMARRADIERTLASQRSARAVHDLSMSLRGGPRRQSSVRRREDGAVVAGPWIARGAEDSAVQMLARRYGPALARRASLRRPADRSFRDGAAMWQKLLTGALGLAIASCALGAPAMLAQLALWAGFIVIAMNAALWLTACLASADARPPARRARAPHLPRISLLVPLYRETETLDLLIGALRALAYPPGRLEIKIVLEEDDEATRNALRRMALPGHFEILIAPDGAPRTKPRALNYALDFTTGEVIGIYDAEDRPAPDQLLDVAAVFAGAGPATACVQARLSYYNAKENWITRCFELEYAAWFEVMLPGLRRLGIPLPLGGTSLFLRREAIEAVGGWDSHNVTEDADLGVALARAGYETALSASITEEEASSNPGAWVRQRSRWLKGYLATWATHMRSPGALIRDIGWRAFIGLNAVLLGAVLGYLLLPPLWILAIVALTIGEGAFADGAGAALTLVSWVGAVSAPALAAAAALGLARRGRSGLTGWIATTPAYWVFGAAAAYLAVWELIFAPTRWRKTRHGVGEIAGEINAARRR